MNAARNSREFREHVRRDLRAALKSRQADRVSALRTLIAAVDNAEAVPADANSPRSTPGVIASSSPGVGSAEVPRRELDWGDVQAILRDLLVEYRTQAEQYRSNHRHEAADRLGRQADVLQVYLCR
ncbi:hypothetical protein JRC04_09380 [Mycolicibacterium sp. S2-37]|uniref:hypothetical protein n=1 Tax=Mycolicibacterium sp. S2-37 TaxID=2810297 RepID=UPI001A94766C|nr:hypothetical protein [Mycolicibacterium sp. S2-37]MBO0677671.1 hypothetical protein [Mycolicibacterium sp. S2-37]